MKKIRHFLYTHIPPDLRFRALNAWKSMVGFSKKYYSQNGEDIILNSIFSAQSIGFYVDIGAHHPKHYSNTFLLYQKGWRGINVDANPESIHLFKRSRPRDINVIAGVGTANTTLSYHRFSDPAVNTFSESEAAYWKSKRWITYLGSEEIPLKSAQVLIDTNLPTGTTIDLLSIDVEGLDLAVLETIDFTKNSPRVIVIEAHNFSVATCHASPIYQFLTKKGYRLSSIIQFSLIFISPDFVTS